MQGRLVRRAQSKVYRAFGEHGKILFGARGIDPEFVTTPIHLRMDDADMLLEAGLVWLKGIFLRVHIGEFFRFGSLVLRRPAFPGSLLLRKRGRRLLRNARRRGGLKAGNSRKNWSCCFRLRRL